MTISTQDSKVNYQGNGQTTVFQIPFPFLENNQIYVQKKDAEGNLINYTYATDYTVTGAGEENGGSVTLNVAPEQGSTISIYRDVPLTQEVDYRENEIFPAETHEEALDKLTMEVQQLQEQLDRSFKVDRFSDVDIDSVINEIERVYDSTDNIDIVANNINDVNTVADNTASVNTVSGDIDSVVTTANNINDVKTVAQNKASLNITAANINDVKTVSSIKDDVHTVAGNNTNITTVATNISDVNTAATNIAAIQDAPNQSAAASASASAALVSQQQAEASATAASASEGKAYEYAIQAVRRNVGDVFLSNRFDDELNGAVECDGAVYQVADFAGENAVPALLAAGALPYVSMAKHNLLINGDQTVEVVKGVVQDGGIVSAQYGGYFKPAISDVPFSTAENWEFETKLIYKNFGGTSVRAIFASGGLGDYKNPVLQCTTAGVVMIFLSSNGTSWNLANNVNSGLTLAEGTEYRLKFGFDGTTYYLKYKTPTDSDFTTKWSLAKTDKIVNAPSICLLNSLITAESPNTYWNGSQMSLPDTALTIDSVEVWRGSTGRPAGVCPYFGWDGAGSATFAVPKRVPRVLIASKEPSDGDQSWFNLYSDGWLEQGGFSTANSVHELCRLQKAYRNTDYTVVTVSEGGTADYIWSGVSATPKTVDSFQFSHRYNGRYVAYGYADVPDGLRVRAMVQLVTGASDQAVVTATSVLPRMNKLESRFQIVSVMPAEPDPDTFYYIVGE